MERKGSVWLAVAPMRVSEPLPVCVRLDVVDLLSSDSEELGGELLVDDGRSDNAVDEALLVMKPV